MLFPLKQPWVPNRNISLWIKRFSTKERTLYIREELFSAQWRPRVRNLTTTITEQSSPGYSHLWRILTKNSGDWECFPKRSTTRLLPHSTNLRRFSPQRISPPTTIRLPWKQCKRLQRNTEWYAFCMKNPLRASTEAANTITGRFPPTQA